MEGYTDALMAHQAGFDNVVASLGHRAHAGPGRADHPLREADRPRVRRGRRRAEGGHVRRDGARGAHPPALPRRLGRRARRRPRGPAARGRDPDEVLRDEPDRWREEVRTAKPIVDHLIDVHARANDLRTPGGKARFVDAVLNVLRGLADPVMRDAYLGQVQRVSGVEERTLLEAMHRRPAREPDGRDGRDRFSAEAVTHAADALPVNDILRAVSPDGAGAAAPGAPGAGIARRGARRRGSRPAAVPGGPRAVSRGRARPGPRTTTASARRTRCPRSSTGSTTRAGPSARRWSRARARTRASWATGRSPTSRAAALELDDAEWQEKSAFNRDAIAEAERDADRELIDRLSLERRLLNEQRRSLDRRRDQTRLLARTPVAAG